MGSHYIVNGSINKVGGDSRDNNNGKICSGVTNGHATNGHTTNGHASNGMGNVHVGNMKLSEFQVEATGEIDVDDVLLESKIEKILTNIGTVSLLATLAFLWIWYR